MIMGILGGCSFREAEERRIRILKEAGLMLSGVPTILHQRICCWHAINLVCMSWTNLQISG